VDKVQRKKITSVKVFFFGAKMKQIILKHKLIFQEFKNLRIFTKRKFYYRRSAPKIIWAPIMHQDGQKIRYQLRTIKITFNDFNWRKSACESPENRLRNPSVMRNTILIPPIYSNLQ